jgi:hypothetical protein
MGAVPSLAKCETRTVMPEFSSPSGFSSRGI